MNARYADWKIIYYYESR